MKTKKVWSVLLLIAMSFSFLHDYAFNLLDNHQHSVQKYISELSAPTSNVAIDIDNIHFEFHMSYIIPAKLISLQTVEGEDTLFIYNNVLRSWKYFNFFKPPIV